MPLARALVVTDQGIDHPMVPGEILAGGESALAGAITTVGNGTWTAAAIATGLIYRSGPTGAYTDTTDTAANILTAISGNSPLAEVVPGTTFRLEVANSVAFALTFAAGTGVVAGNGVLNIAASTVREYLVTVVNASVPQTWQMTGNSASPNVYFGTNVGVGSAAPAVPTVIPFPGSTGGFIPGINTGYGAVAFTPGASATGTNLAASATVLGFIQGQGGIIGVTLSGNNTGAVNGAIAFGPVIKIDGLHSCTL